MFANYHTHTTRCNHAEGTEREYVESAVSGGLKILGFSDHTPYLFGDYHASGIRMAPEELEDYVSKVLSLREEYHDRLEIRIGVEAEFYPDYFDRTVDFLRSFEVEYMILGQHSLGNQDDYTYTGRPTEDENFLNRYCAQCRDGLDSGLFTYFAHPDLINYVGDERIYERHIRPLIRFAVDRNIPLEINLLGLREGRHYPYDPFWKLAGEEGAAVVLGSDAHQPQVVIDPDSEAIALQLCEKYGLKLIENPSLILL